MICAQSRRQSYCGRMELAERQQILTLSRGVRLTLLHNFIDPSEQVSLMSQLIELHSFEQRTIRLFGKPVMQPRLIAWAGLLPYRYSGVTLPARPLQIVLTKLVRRVNESLAARGETSSPFNHVLLNLYRNGNDSMGAHADDEAELGPNPLVASLSLGQERRFQIRLKKKYRLPVPKGTRISSRAELEVPLPEALDLSLSGGSLLLMHPPMQRYYLHGIPKEKSLESPRLNLTFRSIQP